MRNVEHTRAHKSNNLNSQKTKILYVNSFINLVATSFQEETNAICWSRNLEGDFGEIVNKIPLVGNIMIVAESDLLELDLSKQGELAREIILEDMKALREHGASPVLNLIKSYDRDDSYPYFPTDVYSFHVDRSPIPTDTFLCTYYGDTSEILPNSQAEQKILIPEIRATLQKLHNGSAESFESFLSEYFFDLHYRPIPEATPIKLGIGQLWKLAVDHPTSTVQPCVHRAPIERSGQTRLLLIC